MLKEQKDNAQEHDKLIEILVTEVIWLTGRIEKATNMQDSMSTENDVSKNHALTKQKMRLKTTSESERKDKEEMVDEKETNEIIYEKIIRKDELDKIKKEKMKVNQNNENEK